jgi:hypothetical protein
MPELTVTQITFEVVSFRPETSTTERVRSTNFKFERYSIRSTHITLSQV